MVLRNAAVRHGRRTLAAPISRTALRQFSTNTPNTTTPPTATPATNVSSEEVASWATSQAAKKAPAAFQQPKKVRTARRKQTKYTQNSILSLAIDGSTTHQGRQWSRSHAVGTQELSPVKQWKDFRRMQRQTKGLGTALEKRYSPTELLKHPPKPEEVSLELLMASQTHMGHHKSVWNPANARYIYGVREDTHIIALETTAAHLRRAARVVEEVAFHGGIILFVGTRKGQMEVVTKCAEMAGGYHVFTKWAPGSITNREVMLAGHTTKVVDEKDKQLPGFEMFDVTAKPMVPDLVVCLNPLENYTLLYECGLKTIPTIGIIDTDADPTWVTYTIPANDDSLRSVAAIGGVLGRAGQRGQLRRQFETRKGNVTWSTSSDLRSHIKTEQAIANNKRKEVMGMMQQYQALNEEESEIMAQQYARADHDVSEDAMLSIMGQAADGEARATVGEPAEQLPSDASLRAIEEGLESLNLGVKELETALQGSSKASKA